jgi:hypothetical protein
LRRARRASSIRPGTSSRVFAAKRRVAILDGKLENLPKLEATFTIWERERRQRRGRRDLVRLRVP